MTQISLEDARKITDSTEQQYGLPQGTLFKMSGEESSFNLDAESGKGAEGPFQLMPATQKAYGVTDPHDYTQAADAAGRYMRDSLAKYNGNMNMALADYNGGPRAAKALAAGSPWPETRDYLSKFNGTAPAAGQTPSGKPDPLSSAFTSGDSVNPDQSASASDLVQMQAQQRAENGGLINNVENIPQALALGFASDNSVVNWWRDRGTQSTDWNFSWDNDKAGKYLEGIPEKNWDYILQATSDSDADFRRSRMQQSMQDEQKLSEMGVAGFGSRLVGGLVDLPTLIGFVPGMGGEGLLTAGSRIANAVRMGVVGAGTNVGYDVLMNRYNPLRTDDDLYISAAMGLGLGAIGGSLAHVEGPLAEENARLAQWGRQESGKAQIKELTDSGLMRPGEGALSQPEFLRRFGHDVDTKNTPGNAIIWRTEDGGSARIHSPGEEPKTVDLPPEEPRAPEEPPAAGEPRDEPQEPSVGTPGRKQPWSEEWDTPRYEASGGRDDNLILPSGVNRVSQLADYVRAYSKNPETVKVLNRVLKAVDLRKMNFKVIEKGQKFGNAAMDAVIKTAKGAVLTPHQSTGDGIQMFLRGHSYMSPTGRLSDLSGLNEETFVHELVHAATVYKMHATSDRLMSTDPQISKATTDLSTLHGSMLKAAQSEFGEHWKSALEGRLGINLDNPKEMIAYGLTNARFQQWLKEKALPGKPDASLWDRFVGGLRKLLGIGKNEHNALSRLVELANPLTRPGGVSRTVRSPALEGSVDAQAAKAAHIPEVFGWGLGLENKLGKADSPTAVRALAAKLFGTSIGYKDHSVVGPNAWDDTTKWAEGWATQMKKASLPQFQKWFQANGFKWHQKAEAFDHFGSLVSDFIRGRDADFPDEVVRAGETIRKTLDHVADYINNPLKDEGRIKLGLTETEIRDSDTGATSVVGTLEKNPNYLPRKHDVNKWNSMVNTWGHEAVTGWWARAYQGAREGISDEAANRWAKWYVRTVEEAHANRTQDAMGSMMMGTDREALKHSLMLNGGYSEEEAVRVMDDMLPTKGTDAGRTAASLKNRNSVNELHTETWTGADGTKSAVSLNDFIHTNAFEVVEPYLRRMAGSVALAKHLDVYKGQDIEKAIMAATENKFGEGMRPGANVAGMRKDLKFAFDRIQGLPMEEFSTLNKSLEMWRNFNVIRLMGGAVWNQVSELSQITGSMGWKATLQAVPTLRALRRDIATGKAPDDLLDHLENTIGGAGADYVARLNFSAKDDWVRHNGDTAFNRKLDAVDNGLRKVAKGVLDYTGMTPLMIQQKRIHAIALVNHWVNHANGAASKLLTDDRLAWMGMSIEQANGVLADLKKYSTPRNGAFGPSHKLDFGAWVKDSPENYSRFMTAMHRESRRVIQENDLSSMIPLMGTTLGKAMFQFMAFTMHGWNKSMLFAANHRDWATLSTVLHGGFLASLTYMGRTMLDSMGMNEENRQKFLDQRMAPGQIVANSFGKISQASLLPNLYDTVSPYPLFSGMRTTSDLSSFVSNPTYQAINGLISMKKLVKNGLSDDSQTSASDIKNWARLLPLNNVAPVSTMLNMIANDYPTGSKQH
ncbi:transglycosylase SLT domain-containing protein [Pseudomonas sp. SAS7]|uniref:lytic transglycosylase domain-containing protein n=1 Tax=Pseudomonas sp. SAS7 TaxID=3156487 RepID=UPI003F963D86